MKKYISCLLVLLVLVLPMLGIEAQADTTGTCGENLTWTLNVEGRLIISGKGDMEEYDNVLSSVPWWPQRASIRSVVVADGVTSICFAAFSHCTNLTGVILPGSITSIGEVAFADCTSLRDIILSEGITSIGNSAFEHCASLTSITIPSSVTSIADDTFARCTNLTSVKILDGVTNIGSSAFFSCHNLRNITIPNSVTSIGELAFSGCDNLTSITLPERLTKLSSGAFSHCTSLSSITLPGSVTRISNSAFNGCTSLESVTIPEGVTSIAGYAFEECTSLNSITIPDGVVSIDNYAFGDCTSLSSIVLPESIANIEEGVFCRCANLATVHYAGTEAQKADILIDGYNEALEAATWHYECNGVDCPKPEIPPTEPEATQPKETIPEETEPAMPPAEETKPTTPPTEEGEPVENPFADVAEDAYYFAPVLWAVENGITNGLSENTFGPAETCTRGQIVTFLQRACDRWPDIEIYDIPFWDVTWDDYFCHSVLWAVEKGITSGMGDGSFAPGAPCTRGQVATFLWRACGQPAPSGTNIFTDIAPGAYYYDAVLWAVENGITNGMGDGTFAPDAPCTRGQIVTFLYRAMA